MRLLITGSAGHLGEGLVRAAREAGHDVLGVDLLPSPTTDAVGSITERERVRDWLRGVDGVLHAATLHKPHVATHDRQRFLDTNLTGTLTLLEEAVAVGVSRFVFTSTTSAFGRALVPPPGAPATWITEDVTPVPRNIYGVTKCAAEDLCQLVARDSGLPCLVLRTSRFFPEPDDDAERAAAYPLDNLQVNELLYRRVDLEDVVAAHLLALERAPALGWGKFIISATTPFTPDDLAALRADAPSVVARLFPTQRALYERHGWQMLPTIERVYVNARAREQLGWSPGWDFARALDCLTRGAPPRSGLAAQVGAKGYHRGGSSSSVSAP